MKIITVAFLAVVAVTALPRAVLALAYDNTIYSKATGGAAFSFGRTTVNGSMRANMWRADKDTWLCSVSFKKSGKWGSPTDNVVVDLMKGATLSVAETLEEVTFAYSGWDSSVYKWILSRCWPVYKGEYIWTRFSRSGSLSDSAYYLLDYENTTSNSTSTVYVYGGSWTDTGKFPYMVIYGTQDKADTLEITIARLNAAATGTDMTTKQCADTGWPSKQLCDVGVYLFYPRWEEIRDGVQATVDTATSSVPFAFLFLDSTADGAATGTDIGSIKIDKDSIFPTTTSITLSNDITLFSSSTVTQYIGSTMLSTLRTLMGLATYIGIFGFIAWKFKELI